MGIEYVVICRDCGVYQDLDKFSDGAVVVSNRKEALKLGEEFQKKPGLAFRAALLTSFMWEHRRHNCTMTNESLDEEATEGLQLHPSKAWTLGKDE